MLLFVDVASCVCLLLLLLLLLFLLLNVVLTLSCYPPACLPQSCGRLVDHQFEVHSADPFLSVMDNVSGPRFALDIDKDASFRPDELGEHEWLHVALHIREGEVEIVHVGVRMELDRAHVLLVSSVL